MNDSNSERIAEAKDALEKRNYQMAISVLVPLADSGDARAQSYLAHVYHLGLGVDVNLEKAVELYKVVAKRNIEEGRLSALAYHNLATIYFVGGPGIARDSQKGQEYLAYAAKLGFDVEKTGEN